MTDNLYLLRLRGQQVQDLAELYERDLGDMPRDIRDDLIQAQQMQIEALSNMLIDLGRQANAKELATKGHEGTRSFNSPLKKGETGGCVFRQLHSAWDGMSLYIRYWQASARMFYYRFRPRWL